MALEVKTIFTIMIRGIQVYEKRYLRAVSSNFVYQFKYQALSIFLVVY
jgi:hypothetical protein